jgi:hypothetical protein
MKRTLKYLLSIIFIIILFLGLLWFLRIPVGKECGYWNFFESYEKNCQCVGMRTGGCPLFATCDGATYYCLGVCKDCVCRRISPDTNNWKEVSCDNECELHGGKCYGFGDFVAETCEDHGMITSNYKCPVPITINTQCCMKK